MTNNERINGELYDYPEKEREAIEGIINYMKKTQEGLNNFIQEIPDGKQDKERIQITKQVINEINEICKYFDDLRNELDRRGEDEAEKLRLRREKRRQEEWK